MNVKPGKIQSPKLGEPTVSKRSDKWSKKEIGQIAHELCDYARARGAVARVKKSPKSESQYIQGRFGYRPFCIRVSNHRCKKATYDVNITPSFAAEKIGKAKRFIDGYRG